MSATIKSGIHEITIDETTFYTFWQEHRRAIMLDYDDKYKQWDTIVIKCEAPRWKNLPIYRRISFIEYSGMNTVLLHLK